MPDNRTGIIVDLNSPVLNAIELSALRDGTPDYLQHSEPLPDKPGIGHLIKLAPTDREKPKPVASESETKDQIVIEGQIIGVAAMEAVIENACSEQVQSRAEIIEFSPCDHRKDYVEDDIGEVV